MAAQGSIERAVSAWLTALARLPSAAADVAGVDLAVDQQRPDQRQRGDPGDRQAGDGEAEAPLRSPLPVAAARACASCAQRAATRTPAARKKIAPIAAISQNQSIAGADREGERGRRAGRRRARAAARAAPRQAAKPVQSSDADQRQHQQPADQPQLGEGLQVERVGVEVGTELCAQLVPGER